MRFAPGAVYMIWHLQQVMPTRHIAHAFGSWGHALECATWRAATARMGVTGDGARSGDADGETFGKGDGTGLVAVGGLSDWLDGPSAAGRSRIFRTSSSGVLVMRAGLEALRCLVSGLTGGGVDASRALILPWVTFSALVSFGAGLFGAGWGARGGNPQQKEEGGGGQWLQRRKSHPLSVGGVGILPRAFLT